MSRNLGLKCLGGTAAVALLVARREPKGLSIVNIQTTPKDYTAVQNSTDAGIVRETCA
ncbi:hypothetical protein GCM10009069_30040 [Algimonas arctica]|uniref:Uncharacterized protein n=1 Tax=Algimonas arctica TaxID=1479486 RepID=A0A8J3CSE8_9PROT|nr:hypothetical protein GCM10009069_30040 [Algimonas arctica]